MAKESCTPPTNFGQLQLPGTVQENEGCVQSNSSLERLTHVHSHLASVESPNIIDNVQSDSVALANHLKGAHSPHMSPSVSAFVTSNRWVSIYRAV